MVQTIKVLLANAHQDGTAFNFTESRSCDDFILKGSTGFGIENLVIIQVEGFSQSMLGGSEAMGVDDRNAVVHSAAPSIAKPQSIAIMPA